MSKMDELRALREARYERTLARAADPATKPRLAAAQPAARTTAPPPAEAPEDAEAAPELCGHRNMSGRTCTREHGHSAKSHRYS